MPNKGTTGTIFITSLVWRGPCLGIKPGTSRTRSHYSTTRLSRRRCNHFKYRHDACLKYIDCFSLQFQIVSNTVRMHAWETLFSKSFLQLQIPSEICLRDIVFKMFSAVPNHFKYRHSACFRDIVFKMFPAVPHRFKYYENKCLRDIVFKKFSAVPNRVRMHALANLPLVAIYHVLLIWSFGNCVLL